MPRQVDLEAFYELLAQLEKKWGGTRRLGECDGRMPWPDRGVYFFFEPGEQRRHGTPRVVRVGTHALTQSSSSTIWGRLRQHRGGRANAGGNHRGSIFRLLAGEAMLIRDGDQSLPSWGSGSSASKTITDLEKLHEGRVSRYIGSMELLVLPVPDAPSPSSERAMIERHSIALLSRYLNETSDPPGQLWLGSHSGRERVRRSGLWNNNHVDAEYDPGFLDAFRRLLEAF